ncbi:hypothetical protein LEP1GSC080_4741 [Leptospira interrogans str. FPW2026]|nr:hypothetical protein LEP1GSC080_4741 [Leptospira interrogans str. FPW2026]
MVVRQFVFETQLSTTLSQTQRLASMVAQQFAFWVRAF